MQTVLLVVQLLIAVALIGVILIQRTAQDGGGLMGGGSTMGGLFTARGSANLITRTTAILATCFILNSLALGYIASASHREHSVIEQPVSEKENEPVTPPSGTVDQQTPANTPDTPQVPNVPQVPLAK